MKLRIKLPLVLMIVTISWSQGPPAPIDARPGVVATGHIESERDGKLYLNTNPCKPRAEARIVVFHQPYKKNPSEQITCYPNRFDGFTVEQQ